MLFPSDVEGQQAVLADLAQRSYPSLDLFLYSLLSGAILAAGYWLDAQGVLIFGVLTAPLLTPWVGLSVAIITGSLRYFLQTAIALLISAVLVFLIGVTAGAATLPFEPRTHHELHLHSRLWLPTLVVLALGMILLTLTFVRTTDRPYLPSSMLAYGVYLPVSAAGFGLGGRFPEVWPAALWVAIVHFVWATLFGVLILAALRFRPRSFWGFVFSLSSMLALLVVLLNGLGLGMPLWEVLNQAWPSWRQASVLPTDLSASPSPLVPSVLPSPIPPFVTPTMAPANTASATPSRTASPTLTATPTFTPTWTATPTPVYAIIRSKIGGGARLRKSPNGEYITTLNNGTVVEVLGEVQVVNRITWVKVAVLREGQRIQGWVLQAVLAIATPVDDWRPTLTPSFSPTP